MVTYQSFRTGLTYRDVYQMLWSNSKDPKDWRYKRRRTVLGVWRSIKLGMWDVYCGQNKTIDNHCQTMILSEDGPNSV